MSDQQQGPGWWQASDGKWYAPESSTTEPAPDTWAAPTPTGPPPGSSGVSSGGKTALVITGVIGVLVLAIGAFVLLGGDDDEKTSSTTTEEQTDTTGGTDTTEEQPDTTDGSGDVPDGFEVIEGDGVSIAAPEGWQVIGAEDFDMTPEELADAFPDAPPGMIEQGVGLFEQGAVLVAFDTAASEFASNVNVIDIPQEAPLDAIEGQAADQLASLGGEVLDSGIVDVALGEALRIVYTLEVALPDGSSIPAEGVQFYLPYQGSTYIITVSTQTDAAGLGDQMVDTFEVG